jgi:hypothetical protein
LTDDGLHNGNAAAVLQLVDNLNYAPTGWLDQHEAIVPNEVAIRPQRRDFSIDGFGNRHELDLGRDGGAHDDLLAQLDRSYAFLD